MVINTSVHLHLLQPFDQDGEILKTLGFYGAFFFHPPLLR